MSAINSLYLLLLCLIVNNVSVSRAECIIPMMIRGSWFSFEKGSNRITDIDGHSMTDRGECVAMKKNTHEDYQLLFKDSGCYHCSQIYIRTVNVLETKSTGCVTFVPGYVPSLEEVCSSLTPNQALVTLFNENFVPKNCRSVLEGVWQFAYRNKFSFTGECNHPEAIIRSCQQPGNQFLIANQKFTIDYKKCPGIKDSYEGTTEYSCLGDWLDGKNHYFAVANTKESRKEEKYRCFIRNRDDDVYMGQTITPECSALGTPENSPARLKMTPVKSANEQPGCLLPQNFTGEWMNTAHVDADITINQTHIVETSYPNVGRFRRTIYVCKERRDNRFMMARLNIDGCQTDYVCFDFLPRHHSIIRFRKGLEMISQDFSTVCSYIQFKSGIKWSYSLMLAKRPVFLTCPLAGKFNFTQKGEMLLETRLLGGATKQPWDGIYCRQNISDFSVCDREQQEITIEVNKCISVDSYGREVDMYSLPDYKLKCIGYWKENMKSYLITFDERDPVSRYRCWVYQRADLNRIILSQSVGPFCNVEQTVHAKSTREGAAVSLYLVEYEREHDRCPMRFDDGANPWKSEKKKVPVFDFSRLSNSAGGIALTSSTLLLTALLVLRQ